MKSSIKNKTILFYILSLEMIAFVLTFLVSMVFHALHLVPLVILSVLCLTCLFGTVKWFFDNYLEAGDRRLVLLFSVVTSVVGIALYTIIVYCREYEYVMDYTVYFNQQNELHTLFQNSPIKGMAAIVSSMWNSDYSYFINILLEAPFCVSTGSRNSYEIIYCVFFIVPVFFANNVFLMNLYYRFSNRTDKKLLLTLGSILALFAPVLHFASWLGMPDIFGMFFVFGIIVLLINFNQEKFEWRTAVALALLIICLTVTRRWYLFWIVGFVPTIMVLYLAFAAIRDRSRLKPLFFSELKTGLLVIGFAAVVLAPFLYHNLIARDYAEEYSQWYYGGFPYEINHQIFLLGWLFIGLIAFGIIYRLVKKKLRISTITAVFGFLISLLAFTRIQNMGYHHCLLLFGFYILPLYNCLIFIINCKNKVIKYSSMCVLLLIVLVNTLYIFGILSVPENPLLTGYRFGRYFEWKFFV